jgi:hypothetical protein
MGGSRGGGGGNNCLGLMLYGGDENGTDLLDGLVRGHGDNTDQSSYKKVTIETFMRSHQLHQVS